VAAEFDETYQQIKAAAVRLFARQGYVATGIRDIAKEAGYSSTALYHHIPNKEELLVDIMRQGFEMQIGNARAALAGERSPEARLAALVRQHVLFETAQQTLATVVTVEYRFLGPEARQNVLPLRNAYEQIWREVIEEGVESGSFDVPDPRLARLAVLEMCAAPETWYRPDGRLSAEEIADVFAEMALDLVRARKKPRPRARRTAPSGV
jgi:AcrR family transcriptional regulator